PGANAGAVPAARRGSRSPPLRTSTLWSPAPSRAHSTAHSLRATGDVTRMCPRGYHEAVSSRRRRTRAAVPLLLLLACGCALTSSRAGGKTMRWRYRVEVPAALDRLRVELCFPDAPPRRLKIDEDDPAAIAAVSEVAADGGEAHLDRERAAIVLGPLPPGACVRYAVALETLHEGAGSRT